MNSFSSFFRYTLLLVFIISHGYYFSQENLGCLASIEITEGTHYVDGITDQYDALNSCYTGASYSVWYKFVPAYSGIYNVNSSIDSILPDTRLSLYYGNCNDLICVSADDDGGEGYSSSVDIYLDAGVPLYIEWDDRWANGAFNFEINAMTDVAGCMDPEADNYNPNAIEDDGSCIGGCNTNLIHLYGNPQSSIYSNPSWSLINENGVEIASGNLPDDTYVCLADGCYSINMNATNDEGWGSGSQVIFDLGSSEYFMATLPSGNAGNLVFPIGDGTCDGVVFELYGCMDPEALNYDPSVTSDNGSCLYPVNCSSFFEVLTVDEENGIVWIINPNPITDVDSYTWDFGDGTVENTTEFYPTHVYEDFGVYTICLTVNCINGMQDYYCLEVEFVGLHHLSNGFTINVVSDPAEVVGIAETISDIEDISFYPNPASDMLYATYHLPQASVVDYTLYETSGKVLFQQQTHANAGENTLSLDVKDYQSGFYILELIINNVVVREMVSIVR